MTILPWEMYEWQRELRWMNLAAQHMPGQPGVRRPGNPHGYNPLYLSDPYTYISNQAQRGSRLALRIEPPSPQYGGGPAVPSTAWYGIARDRRDAFIQALLDHQKINPDDTFELYIGARQSSPYTLNMATAREVPDLDNLDQREAFETSILPWLDAGCLQGVIFDAGSGIENLGRMLLLMKQIERRYGLHAMTEAIIHHLPTGGVWPDDIRWGLWAGFPMMCISRFMLFRDPEMTVEWPDESEVHILSSPHARPDGSSGVLTPTEISSYRGRGWKVGSTREWIDDSVTQVIDTVVTIDAPGEDGDPIEDNGEDPRKRIAFVSEEGGAE